MSTYSFTEDEERVLIEALIAHRYRLVERVGNFGGDSDSVLMLTRHAAVAEGILRVLAADVFGRRMPDESDPPRSASSPDQPDIQG